MRSILGLVPTNTGRRWIFGKNFSDLSDHEQRQFRAKIGVLFQHGALFSTLTVIENVIAPMKELGLVPESLRYEFAATKLDLVGLPRRAAHLYPSDLSGGMIKRAGIARALALDPKLVFLDEPTSGLDPIGAKEFDEMLRELCKNLGFSAFLITHDLDSLERVCDRVLVLDGGHLIADGRLSQIKTLDHAWVQNYFGVRKTTSAKPLATEMRGS